MFICPCPDRYLPLCDIYNVKGQMCTTQPTDTRRWKQISKKKQKDNPKKLSGHPPGFELVTSATQSLRFATEPSDD